MIDIEMPKNKSSIIKVIGVGGGGGNAVNSMYNLGIEGVDFIVCNTDSQALAQSLIPTKIQLGPDLTQGLGAGANPEVGKGAGEESLEAINKLLELNTKMAFITAGMGGGTGTGAAPVIAKACRDLGILTVGIVTTPFFYEGRKRMNQAKEGITALRDQVDTILIISNDKLRQHFGNLPFSQAFEKADNILATAARCITDLITVNGKVNLDFNDVQTVMKNGGVAILGNAVANGEDRAQTAVEEALNSPLLNDDDITGAKWILLNVTSSQGEFEHTLDELDIIQSYVQEQAGNTCDIILGMGHDPDLGENLAVTVIATGFHQNDFSKAHKNANEQNQATVLPLNIEETTVNQKTEEVKLVEVETDPLEPKLVNNNIELELNTPDTNNSNFDFVENIPSPVIAVSVEAETPQDKVSDEIHSYTKSGLSEFELEEKERFELQKRALEERAERLRKMSFNFHGNDTEEIENVPAYVRRTNNEDEPLDANSKPFLSSYNVSGNDKNKGNISTINTFLDDKNKAD
ncbi:MAG TPA: cell division protein FtsZ [Edaphocola sp.]|nr:cell division protein FtsZ [Edaphocola sp.]